MFLLWPTFQMCHHVDAILKFSFRQFFVALCWLTLTKSFNCEWILLLAYLLSLLQHWSTLVSRENNSLRLIVKQGHINESLFSI